MLKKLIYQYIAGTHLTMESVKYGIIALLVIVFANSYSQIDSIGSGGAISFDGIDDYIDFGDIYADLELPFTISAWVNLHPQNGIIAPIFANRNCDPLYTGFRLMVDHSLISMDYGDGFGGNNPAFRRGKGAGTTTITGNWNHIAAVVRGNSDMDLYLNGINVGGSYNGQSSNTMDSSKPGFASAGYFISNGVIYRLKGTIDDIRLWDRALSELEIRNTMCVNLKGNEPGLIGYWDFNETSGNMVHDRTANGFHGKFVGNPIRVRSGAPIGNISMHLYTDSWAGQTVSLSNHGTVVNVSNVSSSTKGVQIYSVNNPPSNTTGLNANSIPPQYFGVFLAQQIPTSESSVQIDFQKGDCGIFVRNNNSSEAWSQGESISIIQQRIEIAGADNNDTEYDLGENITLCGAESYQISSGLSNPDYQFRWSNGQTTPSITVSGSGWYSVQIDGPDFCVTRKDSVAVFFLTAPSAFSLGSDTSICRIQDITLRVPDCDGCNVTWQDGSNSPEYQVSDFGKHWAVLKNGCGEVADSIVVSKREYNLTIPNVITPNGDGKNDLLEFNSFAGDKATLEVYNRWGVQVFRSASDRLIWDGGELPAGVYFVVVKSGCLDSQKTYLHVVR